jgi:8-oxo-dGTP pyrophosphatase MutT (NUDIX family)
LWRGRLRLPLSALERRLRRQFRERPDPGGDPAEVTASVAAILVPAPDTILLIRRAERSGDPWSGQMALPGGRRDATDGDPVMTAMRETLEEVGVALPDATLLGALPDVAPKSVHLGNIVVRPFLFVLPERPVLTPNREVAEAGWVRLDVLKDPANYRPYTLELRGEPRTFPAYHIGDSVVWGMTERILSDLLPLLP